MTNLSSIAIKWTHCGIELPISEKHSQVYLEDLGVARLTVSDVVPSDAGEYSCEVTGDVIDIDSGTRVSKSIFTLTTVLLTG